MSKVEVLCPNGHRVSIDVLKTTKIIKILEEACLRKGFLPTYDYEIRQGKKTLELSSSVQQAGLVNLAKLDLVKRSKPWVESKVLVQVQTSEGSRMQKEFMPGVSLFEMLEGFEEDDGSGGHAKLLYHSDKTMHPVLVYVKEEVIGHYALKETTLKSLGVLGGRVMFRHMYRQMTIDALKAVQEDVDKEKLRFAKLLEKSAELVEKERSAAVAIEREKATAPLEKPGVVKRTPSPVPQKKILVEDSKPQTSSENVGAANPQQIVFDGVRQNVDNRNVRTNLFADFKFPEETKGKNVYRNELTDVSKGEFQSCDRELVIYKLDEPMDVDDNLGAEEIPDAFFEVTETDLAILQRDLEKNVKQLAEQPLMTQAMRQQQLEMKVSKYKRVVIRVQFPDRLVVQGVFRPRETVYAVYKFVKDLLRDESLSFELYTSPPKHVLKDKTLSLVEANLVPLTRLYLGSTGDVSEVLVKKEVLNKTSTRLQADEVVSKYVSVPSKDSDTSKRKLNEEDKKAGKMDSSQKGQTKSAAPKWLQLGKK